MTDKVLVIDDDVETTNFLNVLLVRQGYQVIVAKDGMHGLELAASEHPDVIILDVMMPDLNGFQVARRLRSQPVTENIPIVMFTARTQMDDKLAGYEAGVDFYLTKPVHPVELAASIKALVSPRRVPASGAAASYTVGVLSPKGGMGVSTLALSLAIVLQQKTKGKVIAAEMRPGQGSWGQELSLSETDGLAKLLSLSPNEITAATVDKHLARPSFGVRLLLASNKNEDVSCAMGAAQYEVLLSKLAELASMVVLDIGTSFHPSLMTMQEACRELLLVTDANPTSVRRTRMMVDELRTRGLASSKVLTLVMFSRARVDMAMSLSQVEEIVGLPVALGIPPVPEVAYNAAVRGVPIALLQPEGMMAQQVSQLGDQILKRMKTKSG